MITITIIIDGSIYYAIPGTDNKYYISMERDIYSIKRHTHATKEGNTIRLAINGSYKRHNCDKLLIEALSAYIAHIKCTLNSLIP